jgi:hypothetical protein
VQLSFLTPESALVAVLVLVPLLALVRAHGVGRRLRGALGIAHQRRRALVLPLVALGATAAFLGVAAAQPVVSKTEQERVRTDAEAYVVFDTSRSMLASAHPGSPSRLARAKAEALVIRKAIPTVPVGIASVTDRTLPHLFPSPDERTFEATLRKAVGIERPPPVHSLLRRVTSLESLGAVATQGFFSPEASHRVLVVFTDGETLPGTRARLGPLFERPPGVSTVFVHTWGRNERVFVRGAPEVGYRPDPSSGDSLRRIADAIGATYVSENDLQQAIGFVRKRLGNGPTLVEGERRHDIPLAPPLAAAAFLPLLLLLWRRDR